MRIYRFSEQQSKKRLTGDPEIRLLAFYAARGWSPDDLNRAACWTPAEREFFRVARNQYWNELVWLGRLLVRELALCLVPTDSQDQREQRDSWTAFYRESMGVKLTKEED